ncbi:MAG: transcription-repair coupling factor [Planctomycetota bacterium]
MSQAGATPTEADEHSPAALLAAAPALRELAAALVAGDRVIATGAAGSSTTYAAAATAQIAQRPLLLIVAHLDEADEAADEIRATGLATTQLAALDQLSGRDAANAELLALRLASARRIASLAKDKAHVVVAPIAAIMQLLPAEDEVARMIRTLRRGEEYDTGNLLEWLADAGYRRAEAIEEPGDFAVRGGIIDIFPVGGTASDAGAVESGPAVPCRLDFFGDELDRISEIDLDTMGSDRALGAIEIVTAKPESLSAASGVTVIDLLPASSFAVIAETLEVIEQGRGFFERALDGRGIVGPPAVMKRLEQRLHATAEINRFSAGQGATDSRVELPIESLPSFDRDAASAIVELAELPSPRVIVACQNRGERDRLIELLDQFNLRDRVTIADRYVHRGFICTDHAPVGFALVPYHELVHRFEVRRRAAGLKAGRAMDTFVDLQVGDFVVHQDHGIARFAGLELMDAGTAAKRASSPGLSAKQAKAAKRRAEDAKEEFLTLEFAGSTRLHVPATQVDLVQKYVGGFSGKPPLSTVGGTKWKNAKSRVADSVRDLAGEMLRVRAAREHMPGVRYPADTTWMREFEDAFPYEETEDQLAALSEIKNDLTGEQPMDRLICGDVGFGKTELAIRAAFKVCEFGKQVAVLVPTTVLAEQHERTFRSRFADYPFRVESLSRFKTTKEINHTLAALRRGEIDLVIGTHRLLSKDVRFADLGLVVVDEEQRFGVEHKERLLQLRMTVEVLTLSATPIPRTLHMAMLGLRDISSLTTPPLDRRAIVTEVIPYNPVRIQRAIERELAREGQCYFIHNRVHNIHVWADEIKKLVPDARIVVGHGQMPPKELEKVMLTFMRREAEILIATTIVESGIDIASANTMFINEADRYGLADLHQLRGRVGRSKNRAYCYLLLPPDRAVKEVAQKRLKAIEHYAMLGAGFKIAMRDLEIRGAGNLLGSEQSGHIAAVGYELYCRLLEDAVRELRHDPEPQAASRVAVDIGVHGYIPKAYIPSAARRLEAYRRLATAVNDPQLDALEHDLSTAYGSPPKQVGRLVDLARIRSRAASLGVRAIASRGEDIVFACPDPDPVREALGSGPGTVRTVDARLAQTAARGVGGTALAEVYLRLERNAREPLTLLRILTKRLEAKPKDAGDTPSSEAARLPPVKTR